MQRLIDAEEANKAIKKICDDYGIAYGNNYGGFADKIASVIDNMPTIDAEPVVRCKNCKYHYMHEGRIMCNIFCNLFAVAENHYCSYGAKMDKEAEQE